MPYSVRSDLALERKELLRDECTGVSSEENHFGDIKITRITVENDEGSRRIGKPCGTYTTIELPCISQQSENDEDARTALSVELSRLLPKDGPVLVAGLGNSDITPDALGPKTIEKILATRHISGKLSRSIGLGELRPVAAVSPGVLGKTGIETAEILSGIVGREMCDVLNSMGINTLHDETLHDSPSYTGSYSRAAKTIQSYLEKYPSIGFVIDVHRDSIGGGNSPRVKPTVEINGKPAAQIMFVTGCETGEVTDYPNWKYNLQTALKFQRRIEQDHSGLTRSVYFTDCRYNMNLTKGSVLMEFGSDANTLDEAVYSAHLAAESIARVLLSS